jgi:pimeloyl-ACP methyl ester carboxylesterase
MAGEVATVHAVMLPALDAGREIMLIGHSYGGLVITPAAKGLSTTERAAQGLEGGIKSVVYLQACASWERGVYPLDIIWGCGDGLPDHLLKLEVDGKVDGRSPWPYPLTAERQGLLIWSLQATDNILKLEGEAAKEMARAVFFNTCTTEQSNVCFELLESMSLGAALEPTEVVPADLNATLTYILGEEDNALSVALAEKYLAGTPGMKTIRMKTGHAPWVDVLDELMEILEAAAME